MDSVKSPDTKSAIASSKRETDLLLVKDLQADRIVYYWTDIEGAIISPLLASLVRAEEWRKVHLQENYRGRRAEDQPIRVDCDLAEAKLNALLAPHKKAAEAEQRKKQQ